MVEQPLTERWPGEEDLYRKFLTRIDTLWRKLRHEGETWVYKWRVFIYLFIYLFIY